MTVTRVIKNPEAALQSKVENAVSDIDKVEVQTSHATEPPQADTKTLTTEHMRKTAENVVEDVKVDWQGITPAGEQFMKTLTEEQLAKIDWSKVNETTMLGMDAIVARDLKLPSYLNIRPKDPSMEFRWVNRKHNGDGGNRYEIMVAMGFVNARPEDCNSQFDVNRIKVEDHTIICNDLILMKISKYYLYGMYKANLAKANRTFTKKNVHQQAKDAGVQELRSQLSQAGISPSQYKGKLSMFIPDKTPLDPTSTDI